LVNFPGYSPSAIVSKGISNPELSASSSWKLLNPTPTDR
jgi:hypothetical protein